MINKHLKEGLSDIQIKKRIYKDTKIIISSENIQRCNDSNSEKRKVLFFLDQTEFVSHFSKGFFSPKSLDHRLNDVFLMIVRDNKITDIEKRFIRNKIEEYSLEKEIIENVDRYIDSNNPYLDRVFDLVWGDGKVEEDEIEFLKEKISENLFDKKSFSKRFWQYSIFFHFDNLINYPRFNKLYKIFSFCNFVDINLSCFNPDHFFENFVITEYTTIEECLENALIFYERELIRHDDSLDLDSIYSNTREKNSSTKSKGYIELEVKESSQERTSQSTILSREKNESPQKEDKSNVNLEGFEEVLETYSSNPFKAFDIYKNLTLEKDPKAKRKALREGFEQLISLATQ